MGCNEQISKTDVRPLGESGERDQRHWESVGWDREVQKVYVDAVN